MPIVSVGHFMLLLCVESYLFLKKHFMIAMPSSHGQQGIFVWRNNSDKCSTTHVLEYYPVAMFWTCICHHSFLALLLLRMAWIME